MNPAAAISKWLLGIASAAGFFSAFFPPNSAAAAPIVSILAVDYSANQTPAQHGLTKLKEALQAKAVPFDEVSSFQAATGSNVLVVGLTSGTDPNPAATLIADLKLSPAADPESVLIRRTIRQGKNVVLVAGSDPRGLMYALLEVAERVAWARSSADPFSELRDTNEGPYAPDRALSIYTFNRAYWESRFYDEAYWARYLDLLAENRFNSLVVIFGYENGGFLAPCYPYFFDVEGFPDVRMVGLAPAEQERNLRALHRLIQMAHQRGLKFTAGIWDHIYRGGVQGGGIPGADDATKKPTPGLVWGVTAQNLVPYTRAALAQFVQRVPDLDAIQFRMHDESGLKNSEQEAFWRDIFQMMKQAAPHLRLDLRAKGLPDSVIKVAVDTGIPFRITTKYWMEQMGLPFHPTHINKENQFDRRHSYADLLRYPQNYKMHWRLWNGGTARLLLWGDPDYARRFVESSRLYDGDGFEVNEPLCTKMEAQPHDRQPFDLLTPSHRYYQYEFERYWHFFQVFGRIGYNTNASPELWDHEFQKRFGVDAGPLVEKALHQASWVLPRIVASCYPYSAFPMTRGWAEKQPLGNLRQYARAEGSDIQQFASFDEEAQILIEGGETAKVRPGPNSQWFAAKATEISALVAEAENRAGTRRNKEFDSTVADLKILANLALFHSRRIPAAVNYRLFERTKDPHALDDAIAHEQNAIAAWRQLVAAAGDFYSQDLMMGVRGADLCGHWKDELAALEGEILELQNQRRSSPSDPALKPAPRFPAPPNTGSGAGTSAVAVAPLRIRHDRVTSAPVGQPLAITAGVVGPAGVKWVRLRYRSVNQHQDYKTLPMVRTTNDNTYQAVIPAGDVVPTWDLMYFIEAMDQAGNARIYPDLDLETPYIIIRLQRQR